jgi:DNA repair exonuclease SbcCD ATPase subunit
MPKTNKIEKEYERLEKDIHMMAEKEIKNIENAVKKLREKAEKIGEELESSLTEKSVKSKNSDTSLRHFAFNWRK